MTDLHFEYPSNNRLARTCYGFGMMALLLSLYVWLFTGWLPGTGRGIVLGAWALVMLSITLSSAVEVFRPVRRACWIRHGVFGWSAPRCRPPAGEVPLAEITAIRLNTSERHFTIQRSHGTQLAVPEQCVQEAQKIAREIVMRQPSAQLYVDGNLVA
jgi:hypothetical protein